MRSSSAGIMARLAWATVVVVVAVTDLHNTISVMMIGKFRSMTYTLDVIVTVDVTVTGFGVDVVV